MVIDSGLYGNIMEYLCLMLANGDEWWLSMVNSEWMVITPW